jgi:PAS domain S-box-containing protein
MAMTPEISAAPDRYGTGKLIDPRSTVFAAVMDTLPEGIYLFDAKKELVRINQAATYLERRASAELEGHSCCSMMWKVKGQKGCVVDRALERGEPVEVEIMIGPHRDQPTIVRVFPIKDLRGRLTGDVVVTANNVSELRRVEAEAVERKAFMSSLAALSPDEIYALDGEARIIWMNERAEAANDYLLTGVLRRPVTDFIAPDSLAIAAEAFSKTLKGDEIECELQTIRAKDEVRDVEVHTAPLWHDGAARGILVYMRDVTERKRAQARMAQADKLRSVGELAAGVAHNLNNVLTVVNSRAQLLLRKFEEDEAVSGSLEAIMRAVADGSQTLRRIMNFARRDQTEEFALVNLQDVIAGSVEIARPKWYRSSGDRAVSLEVENKGSVYTMGDPAELSEVLINFIFNAVDAMPDGGKLQLGAIAEIDAACMWVEDTGVGMPPEIVDRIFEPFFTTKGDSGTGLGLSASQGILARHSGRVTVLSAPGFGTRIEVRLPLYQKP